MNQILIHRPFFIQRLRVFSQPRLVILGLYYLVLVKTNARFLF